MLQYKSRTFLQQCSMTHKSLIKHDFAYLNNLLRALGEIFLHWLKTLKTDELKLGLKHLTHFLPDLEEMLELAQGSSD